ncbi:hypothetical protein KAR91_13205 [Candidatus Pacearchaeota archaeon]|nr:hypothetical protein [Candidatus Pacearchaeota archaeon]
MQSCDEKNVILQRRKGLTKIYPWDDVVAITTFCPVGYDITAYRNFALQMKQGDVVGFVIRQPDVHSALEGLYDAFLGDLIHREIAAETIDFFPAKRVLTRRANHKRGFYHLKVDGTYLLCYGKSPDPERLCLSEIKSCTLEKTKGRLVFDNGTKLERLEDFCYWPILREYLLSILPTSKTEIS